MGAKKQDRAGIDWEAIEIDWRAGIKPAIQIGEEHGISHTAINKHFRKLGVPRDLTAKIRAKAEAMVSIAVVSGKVSVDSVSETTPTDAQIIDVNATQAANALLGHRSDVKRYNKLAQSLLSELEASTDNTELFSQLGELLRSENEKGVDKLNDIYHKVIAMPGRVDSLKKLSEVLKTLVGLERQALGMSDNANGEADAPKAVPQMSDHEAARRVAFLLQKGIRGTP